MWTPGADTYLCWNSPVNVTMQKLHFGVSHMCLSAAVVLKLEYTLQVRKELLTITLSDCLYPKEIQISRSKQRDIFKTSHLVPLWKIGGFQVTDFSELN